jgi:hypothetical protein
MDGCLNSREPRVIITGEEKMGYSSTVKASAAYDAIIAACQPDGEKSSNVIEHNGNRYFLEIGRENADGAITVTIYRFVGESGYVKAGPFRIEASGLIARPIWARRAAYKSGFYKVENMDNFYKVEPYLTELASAFTTNGVALGDIATIGQL